MPVPYPPLPSLAEPTASPDPNRRFGFLVGGVLLLMAGWHYLRHDAPRPWLLGGGSLLWLLAGLAPHWLMPLRRAWEGVGRVLGWVNTRLLLLLAYGLVCVPLGLLLRLLGKDPLGRRWQPQAPTYWQAREPGTSMNNQF